MPGNRCSLDSCCVCGKYNKHGTHKRVCLSVHTHLQDHCLLSMEARTHIYEHGDGTLWGMCVHMGRADRCLWA